MTKPMTDEELDDLLYLVVIPDFIEDIRATINARVQEEREACIAIVKEHGIGKIYHEAIEKRIRARGKQ